MEITLTRASESLVDWTVVDSRGRWLAVGDRHQPDDRHVGVELLRSRLGQPVLAGVPARPLDEQSADVAAVLRGRHQRRQRFTHHLRSTTHRSYEVATE